MCACLTAPTNRALNNPSQTSPHWRARAIVRLLFVCVRVCVCVGQEWRFYLFFNPFYSPFLSLCSVLTFLFLFVVCLRGVVQSQKRRSSALDVASENLTRACHQLSKNKQTRKESDSKRGTFLLLANVLSFRAFASRRKEWRDGLCCDSPTSPPPPSAIFRCDCCCGAGLRAVMDQARCL